MLKTGKYTLVVANKSGRIRKQASDLLVLVLPTVASGRHTTLLLKLVISWCMIIPKFWTSLVFQLLRIHLPMQRTQIQCMVQEDSTCCRATNPVCHNY